MKSISPYTKVKTVPVGCGTLAVPYHARRDVEAEHSSGISLQSRRHGGGWNKLVSICHFLACWEKSWRAGLWHPEAGAAPPREPGACSPPRTACDGSAEQDAGQGSSGFSSFDGHGALLTWYEGCFLFSHPPPFFFCFNLLLALGLLAFFFFFPKDNVFINRQNIFVSGKRSTSTIFTTCIIYLRTIMASSEPCVM